jgi:hypothetical protein
MSTEACDDGEDARILVSRPRGGSSRYSAFRVVVDDHEVGKLRRGSTLVAQVGAGTHQVRARVNWCSSRTLTLELASGETAELVCSAPAKRVLLDFLVVTVGSHVYPQLGVAS